MNDATWELFDALYKTAHRQGRRIEDLETRITELERRLRGCETEHPALKIVEPTPVDEAWARHGEEVTA